MANYTQSIREILQMHKQDGEVITDIATIYNIANRVLFDASTVNVIDEMYRQAFITGFTLHFFNDELGLETLPLWKIALSEKLLNNGSYINLMYSNLDKQIFSQYRVKKSNDDLKLNESHDNTSNETINGTGTIENAKSGSDVNSTNTVTDMTNTKTINSTDERLESGSYTDSSEGNVTSSGNNTSKTNAVDINYDTPQGKLQSQMVSPGGDRTGKGVKYVTDNTFNYMTAAGERDASVVDDSSNTEESNGTSTRTFNDYKIKNTIDSSETDTGTNTVTGTNTIEYGAKDTQTRNTTDTHSHTDEGNKNVNTERDINEEEYSINMEMILKSENLLNRVWAIFDDIFMQIL